jgi:uncharacterized protein (DUF924 family)
MNLSAIDSVNRLWFEEIDPEGWFKKSEALDQIITQRFAATYNELRAGVPASWLDKPDGYLAAIIVLDQFPRNMFRGEARSFATDPLALSLAKQAIAKGIDTQLPPTQRWFLYMPFEHSEAEADQARCVDLMATLGNDVALDYALRHKAVIDRFGRFPHRNAILDRATTDEEVEFLKQPGSSF